MVQLGTMELLPRVEPESMIQHDDPGVPAAGKNLCVRNLCVRRDWYFQNCFLKVPIPSDAQINKTDFATDWVGTEDTVSAL
jgi:hypothetical protein